MSCVCVCAHVVCVSVFSVPCSLLNETLSRCVCVCVCGRILTGAWLLHLLPGLGTVSACSPGSVLVLFLSLQCPGVARGFPGQRLLPGPQGPCAGTDLRVVLPPAPVGPALQSWRPCWVLPEVLLPLVLHAPRAES